MPVTDRRTWSAEGVKLTQAEIICIVRSAMSVTERRAMIDRGHGLPVARQARMRYQPRQ